MEILKLIIFALRTYAIGTLTFLGDPVIWIFGFLIFTQYRGQISAQQQMYDGKVRYRMIDLVSTSILFGIIAGLIGSIGITLGGITFQKFNGIQFIVFLSLMLMIVNPRYVCLSYAGGLLSFFVLLINDLVRLGYLNQGSDFVQFVQSNMNFDVTALMAIVGVLHFIEAILIRFDGGRGAVPVFMKKDGELVGAFVMQRFWIIPVLLYVLVAGTMSPGEGVATPNWWPLIGPNLTPEQIQRSIFSAYPLIAMLGYGDYAVATTVEKKVKRSSNNLMIFSIILILLSLLSVNNTAFKYAAALFAPIAHEAIILLERYREALGRAVLKRTGNGVMVVDTIPESPAESMGIKTADTILRINNNPVNSIDDLIETVNSSYSNFIWADVADIDGKIRVLEYSRYISNGKDFGVITIPNMDEVTLFIQEKKGRVENKFRSFMDRKKD